jgi:hypothetical protein
VKGYLVYWSTFDDVDGEVFTGCHVFFVRHQAANDAIANGQALDGVATAARIRRKWSCDPSEASQSRSAFPPSRAATARPPTSRPPPDGSTVDPHFSHYRIYLDKVPLDVLMGAHSHDEFAPWRG